MNTSQSVLFLAILLLSKFFVESYRQNDYLIQSSFLQGNGNVLEASNELSEVFLTELEEFNTKVLDKLSDRLVDLFHRDGFDLDDKDNLEKLYTFLQSADVPVDPPEVQEQPLTLRQKILRGLKKAVTGMGKEFLVHATKALIACGIKEALPEFEKIFKNALGGLPHKIRIAVAPLVYKLWKNLFKKAQVPMPKNFSLKGMMLDGLSESERREAEMYLREKVPLD